MADFYTASGDPAQSSSIDSSVIRAEYSLIATGFTKVAGYTGAANRVVHINSGATAQATTSGFTFDGTTFTAPALAVTNNSTLTGNLAVNGGNITSTATTFNLLNATVTTLNIGGAATTVALGAATGTVTVGPAIVGSIATDSTSPTTGAWKTAGGLGVAKALWVGGLANIAGKVRIGGAAEADANSIFETVNSGAGKGAAVCKNDAAAQQTVGVWNASTAGQSSFILFGTEGAFTTRGQIYYDRASTGLTVYATSSSGRLKNLRQLADPNDAASRLRRYEIWQYDWKGDGPRDMIGPYSEQVHSVNPRIGGGGQIDFGHFSPDLLLGWQYLDARIAALEARLA